MQSLAFGPLGGHGSISGRLPLRFVTLRETRFDYSSATPFYIEGNFQVSHPTLRVIALASLVAIVGCHRQADAPGDAPGNLQVESGEGRVTVRWDQQPGLTYWIFFQAGASVTAAAPGVPLIFDVQSPRVVAGLANNTQYAFVMNATNQDSKAGPSTPVVLGSTRLAGATWTPGVPLAPQNLNGLAFSTVLVSGISTARLVAVGNAGTLLAGDYNYTSTSPPGVTAWTQATSVPNGFVSGLSAVTSDLTRFIALGTDGSIVTSADGNTWTSAAPIPNGGMNGLAFGLVPSNPVYVAVGDGGKIFTSTDLTAWTPATSNTPSDLYSVSFPKDTFVVTGAGGTLLTSPDGSTWTVRTSNTPNALRGAAFGRGSTAAGASYVVVGDAGTILTSADGTTWNLTTLSSPQNLRSIAFGSRFVAVGQGSTVVYSDDAINWVQAPSNSGDLAAIFSTPAMYVAVGASGANAVSK
jgi:photosystem II stability/assembly factor-like uncharacterized protein